MQPGLSTQVNNANNRMNGKVGSQTGFWQDLMILGSIALAYFVTAHLSLLILNRGAEASPIWPPAGIALAAVFCFGRWATIGIALGAMASHYVLGVSWGLSLGAILGATLQALVGAYLLRQTGFRADMERLRDVLGFVSFAVLVSPLVNATIGTLTAFYLRNWSWAQAAENWWTIWLGDAMGILIFTPALLALKQWVDHKNYKFSNALTVPIGSNFGKPFAPTDYKSSAEAAFSQGSRLGFSTEFQNHNLGPAVIIGSRTDNRRSPLERWLWLSSLVTVSWAVFYSQPGREIALYPLEYLPFPLVMWAALRFGQSRAVIANLILSAIAISGTVLGRGPFAAKAVDLNQMILLLQAFIGVITITALLLAAVMSTRQAAEKQLRLTAERNRLLSEIAMRIRQSLDLQDILQTTVEEVRQFLQADRVFFSRFEPDGRCTVLAESVASGWSSTLDWESEPCDYQEIQAIFAQDCIKITHDTTREIVSPTIQQYHDRYQVKAGIAVPIMLCAEQCRGSHPPVVSSSPQLLGILIVNQCSSPRRWQPLEIELLEQLGTQVAIAIQQGQLYQQVQTLNANLEQQVTERTVQLQSNMAELEELNRLRDVFIHAIAHDLRTTVMGSLMVLKNLQSQPDEEKVAIPRNFLERMIQSGEIQLCKLNSLLEAYKNKTEGIVVYPESFALLPLVKRILFDLEPMFELNQVNLVNQMTQELPCVYADPNQVERVFRHLLVNAVKHNPPGIDVMLQAMVEGDQLRCVVTDNGKGLSSSQCDRLFDLSISNTQERQLTGISLGLYLCHQIVTAHEGKIGVISEVSDGSQFWFTLPLKSPTECCSSNIKTSA